jgi:hypothetical protein
MRAAPTTSALLVLGLLLTSPGFSSAFTTPPNPDSRSGRFSNPTSSLKLACARNDCIAFCSDRYGTEKTNCMNTCLRRKENCN